MTYKGFIYRILLSTVCLVGIAPAVQAEPATLSDNLKLHIPVIKYQDQFLWADLSYTENASGLTGFVINNYGVAAPSDIPPGQFDLALVTDGSAPEIVDIKQTEARLTFISSIPLACSVVYGKSPAFGAVAIDQNMNGGAIIDHNPILINFEGDTQYYYRVQGTDEQGKLYWAPMSSFTTTSGDAPDNNLLSINNGASVTAVSSNFGGAENNQAWGANSAIDGSTNSAWSSNGDGDDAFIEISLPVAEYIGTVEVWSRFMNDGSAKIFSFTITLDDDVLGPFSLPDTKQAYQFEINKTSSSIRLDVVSSSGGNTGLIEFSALKF